MRSPAAVSTTHPRDDNAGALTIAAARRTMAQSFRAAGLDSPELDARILVGHALGLDQAALAAAGVRVLARLERDTIEALARRRLAREPVARIVGYKEFWSLKLSLTEATLVPRPETETVVEAALAAIDAQCLRARVRRIADLGTGSGALLLALMSELPSAFAIGTDTSERALTVAHANAERLGVAPVAFIACDMAAALRGPFDLIVSNPPYVRSGDIDALAPEVRDFDPRVALDGGPDGLDCYRAIAAAAPLLLAPDGVLVVELGAGQAPAVAALFAAAGLAPQAPRTDVYGVPRALPATIRPRNRHERQALLVGNRSKKALGISAGTD
jgi:release factor glutamine methyltransferase